MQTGILLPGLPPPRRFRVSGRYSALANEGCPFSRDGPSVKRRGRLCTPCPDPLSAPPSPTLIPSSTTVTRRWVCSWLLMTRPPNRQGIFGLSFLVDIAGEESLTSETPVLHMLQLIMMSRVWSQRKTAQTLAPANSAQNLTLIGVFRFETLGTASQEIGNLTCSTTASLLPLHKACLSGFGFPCPETQGAG